MKWLNKVASGSMVALCALSLVACEDGQMTKQGIGTVGGGVIGGLIGSQFGGGNGALLGTGVGVLVGALAGSAIGKSMDDQDKMNMQGALGQTQTNQTVQWNNDQGVHYTFTPTTPAVPKTDAQSGAQTYCREFTQTAVIAGKEQQMYGEACRQPDGTWKVMSSHE
jgi:surface antigen